MNAEKPYQECLSGEPVSPSSLLPLTGASDFSE